jgi:hypothetical protein
MTRSTIVTATSAGVGPAQGYCACQYSVTSPTNMPLVPRQPSARQRHPEVAQDLDLGLVPEDLRVDEQPVHVEDGRGKPRRRGRRSAQAASAASMASTMRVLGLDLGPEAPDDLAGARDEELLEVPGDVAGGALGVGRRRQLLVDGVAVVAVHVDLLEEREAHAVGGRAELLDLLRRARLLAHELVAREADDREAPVAVGLLQRSRPSYCGVRPHLEATLTTRSVLPA